MSGECAPQASTRGSVSDRGGPPSGGEQTDAEQDRRADINPAARPPTPSVLLPRVSRPRRRDRDATRLQRYPERFIMNRPRFRWKQPDGSRPRTTFDDEFDW